MDSTAGSIRNRKWQEVSTTKEVELSDSSRSSAPSVRAVERAMDILLELSKYPRGVGITELARAVGLSKATVYRLLSTLADRGFVERVPDTDFYRLGLAVFDLGMAVRNRMDLVREARPILKEVVERTRETVHLGILDNGEVVYVDKLEGPGAIQMLSRIGRRVPVHCTAMGKVLAADLPAEELERIISSRGLKACTENTITEPEVLKAHLREVARLGFAVDRVEHEHGVQCVAVPIRDFTGRVIGAFSISGSLLTITEERLAELVPFLKEAGGRISRRMGYREEEVPAGIK